MIILFVQASVEAGEYKCRKTIRLSLSVWINAILWVQVADSKGHIVELESKRMGVNPARGYALEWALLPKKKKDLQQVEQVALGARAIILATCPDREGEGISWHLINHLQVRLTFACRAKVNWSRFRTQMSHRGAFPPDPAAGSLQAQQLLPLACKAASAGSCCPLSAAGQSQDQQRWQEVSALEHKAAITHNHFSLSQLHATTDRAEHFHLCIQEQQLVAGVPVQWATFTEITKKAVTAALENPRVIDQSMDAYLARRALDRLFGYTMSLLLCRKLPGVQSAGMFC